MTSALLDRVQALAFQVHEEATRRFIHEPMYYPCSFEPLSETRVRMHTADDCERSGESGYTTFTETWDDADIRASLQTQYRDDGGSEFSW